MKSKTRWMPTILIVWLVLALFYGTPLSPALAATSNPNNPGLGENVTGVGTIAWVNPGNITTVGAPYTTATVPSGTTTNYLRGTQYGFAIPYDSTITGINLVINRQSSGTSSPVIRDFVVSLVKGGIITGDNKARTTTD